LDQARTQEERLTVRAPFDAAATAKLAEVGQWVEPGDGIVELVSTGRIDAEVDVPESAINAVAQHAAEGTPIVVQIDALGEEVTGTVVAVTPDGSSASRTFPAKIRLDDADGTLKPGMSVTARFPLGSPRPTLTVPRDAVLFSTLTPQVWVAMSPEPRAPASPTADVEPVPTANASDPPAGSSTGPPPAADAPMPFALPASVRVLYGQGDRFAIEVLDGPLFPGATVVVEGAESLFPTRPLMYDPAEPAASPDPEGATAQQPDARPPA
jgi:multidrug efflux pump subunit AcrA (membrane-fusion protein)